MKDKVQIPYNRLCYVLFSFSFISFSFLLSDSLSSAMIHEDTKDEDKPRGMWVNLTAAVYFPFHYLLLAAVG
jgi:hypothetical protein